MLTARNPGFEQVCVWQGLALVPAQVTGFAELMAENFDGVRVQYLETISTEPDVKNYMQVPGTGGRLDVFFAVHKDDIPKFALARLQAGIRWIEDVYSNGGGHLYPVHVRAYKTW